MLTAVKKALPFAVFIVLATATLLLRFDPSPRAIGVVGMASAACVALLLYAVIRWDEVNAAQQREKRQLADVVGRSMDAVLIADVRGRILYANDAARAGFAAGDDLAGESLTVLGFEPQALVAVLEGVLASRPWQDELVRTAHDAPEQVCCANLFRLEAFQGQAPVVAVIAHDLTERKALQNELLHSQKLAAVGELAAGLAHEINNPMAAIQSQVGLARDLLVMESAPPDAAAQVLACVEEADRQVGALRPHRRIAAAFSRRQTQDVADVEVAEAIGQALTFVSTLPRMRGVELIHEPGPDRTVSANLESVTQILVNLLLNAADATERRGRVVIRARLAGPERVAIEVQDNGSGIRPDVLERVFEPFFTTKPPPQGTGLGLSISYGLAHALGGDLALRVLAEGGTVATLTLPALEAASSPRSSSATARPPAATCPG